MNLKNALLVPAAALVALGLMAVPTDAQQRRGNGDRGGGAPAPRGGAAIPRQAQPRAGGQQSRSYGQQVQPRSYGQQVQPRSYGQAVPRQGSAPRAYDRSYYDNRGYAGRASYYGSAPRTAYGYGYGGHGHGGYDYGGYGYSGYGYSGYGHGGYGHSGYGHSGYGYGGYGYGYGRGYRPYYYSGPYYAFRPRFSLGFGLWIGFPVAYPFCSYGYANPTYGYPLSSFGLAPGVAYGGISFEIEPHDAAIYVDGGYVGIANDFGPNAQPLTLRAGAHHVEIQATAYAPVVWEVEVIAGQVIPYRGTMQAD